MSRETKESFLVSSPQGLRNIAPPITKDSRTRGGAIFLESHLSPTQQFLLLCGNGERLDSFPSESPLLIPGPWFRPWSGNGDSEGERDALDRPQDMVLCPGPGLSLSHFLWHHLDDAQEMVDSLSHPKNLWVGKERESILSHSCL